uniref:Transmembrane protein n=1 Tax=Panagrolaimus sp. JU765 TaxID=591449 RepID=A0AC34R1L0_9BILA
MFDVCGYRDISKNLVGLEKFPIVRLRFSKGFVFACVQAANEFEEQRTRFFNENEMRDDYMEVREGLDLVETPFVEQMIVYTNPNLKQPWYLSSVVYWICSALLLSWPLRMIEELITVHVHYHATKLFGTNYLSPSSVNYTGPLTRSSTMESADLDRALRENFLIVPSYSEAVLLDPVTPNTFAFPRLRARMEQASNIYCNESVIANYGAIRANSSRPPPAFPRQESATKTPSRSRSMNFPGPTPQQLQDSSTAAVPIPRPSQLVGKSAKGPSRSISISGICGTARSSGYQTEVATPVEERRPLIEPLQVVSDEAPPSYEVALRMCAPIYRQLAHSISSLLNSLSRSNSKDLRHYSLDGPSQP